MCTLLPAHAVDVDIDTDQTNPVLLGTAYTGGGTATIAAGVTVETTGTSPPYAVEVDELPTTWTIDNYGTLLSNSDDSVHCYTDATVNNTGTIASQGGGGSGVAAVFSDDAISMVLDNSSTGLIQGDGVGVVFEFYGVGNTGSIDNQGTIEGGTTGVTVAGGATTITNSGTITGLDGPGVVMGVPGDTSGYTLVNSGTIIGNDVLNLVVSMGEGDDTVELQTGTQIINGDIDGGEIVADTDTDTLVLNGSGAVTWNMYWFEALEKTGSGRWILETDLDLSVSGTTVITTGDLGLNLNITLTSSSGVTVNAPGTLSGDGFVIGSIMNSGTISPGNGSDSPFGTLDVTGDVSFEDGSSMVVDIGALGTRDLLDATGSATLAGINHTIQVSEISAIPDGEVINIITSGSPGISAFELLQQGTSLVVTFSQQVAGNNLGILTTRLPYSNFATTENQSKVAVALYDSVGLSADDLGQVLAHLDFLALEDMQDAFEELQPKSYTTHPGLVLQEADLYRTTISDRLRNRRQELADSGPIDGSKYENSDSPVTKGSYKPDPLVHTVDASQRVSLTTKQSRWKTYIQPYSLWERTNAGSSIEDFDAFILGVLCGTDRPIGHSMIGGFCLGTGITRLTADLSGSSGNKFSLRFGPYLNYYRHGFLLESSLTGSANWLSNRRAIDITGLSRSAKGSYDSYDLAAELAALYELEFWGFTASPEFRLVYDYLYMDDFQESGADSISLVVSDRRIHSFNHSLGGRIGYDIRSAKAYLRPEAWVAWTHMYLGDEQVVQAGFAGAPQNEFTMSTPGTPQERLSWGAGFTLSLASFSGYLRYQADIYQDIWNHGIQGGLSFRF